METNPFIGSDTNVIFTLQTCGQCSNMVAEANDKHWHFTFPYNFTTCSKYHNERTESALGPCTFSGLAETIKQCGCEVATSDERWGAGVEYHFQEFNEPYAPS